MFRVEVGEILEYWDLDSFQITSHQISSYLYLTNLNALRWT